MKIILLLFLISSSVFALDLTSLDNNYPSFTDFELTGFTATRAYFRDLFSHSVQYSDKEGSIVLKVQDKDSNEIIEIRVLIERETFDYDIVERVIYQLSNGNHFEYVLRREGKNLKPLDDLDLLMFKFQSEPSYDTYNILIPTFDVQYFRGINNNSETSYFILNPMDFKFEIDTYLDTNKITRDYIFFYKQMPTPQAEISVIGSLINKNDMSYTHYTKSLGIIDPKTFSSGLNGGTQLFNAFSEYLQNALIELGFPKFE